MHRRVVVCVDFDGVLCQHRFPHIGDIIQPAFDTLVKLQSQIKCRLILWTCREPGEGLEEAVQWCHDHGLDFDTVNEGWVLVDGFALHKVIADFYIDDRNIDWDKDEPETQRWEKIYKKIWDRHCFVNTLKVNVNPFLAGAEVKQIENYWYVVGPQGYLRSGGTIWDEKRVSGTFRAASKEKAEYCLLVLKNAH